jgi:CheY-like chemotaxis protein
MGGTIGVETTVGKGSTFWIELMVAEPPAGGLDGGTQLSHVPVRNYEQPRLVLYVEDNLSNLQLIESIAGLRPSIRLLSTMQGKTAIDLAKQHVPHLILLDIHLPDLGGEEVLQRLQSDPRTKGIPVVMISADSTRHQIERLMAHGVRSYLTKPICIKQFLTMLDELLA